MTTPQEAQPSAPPGMTMIQNVSLEAFERAVYSRNYEEAGRQMLDSLRKLKMGAEFIGYQPVPKVKKVLYSRYCAAIVSLLSDPAFTLSQDGFNHLAAEHATIDMVFRASVFETSDHILPQVSANPTELDRNKLVFSDGPALAKFMLTYSMRSAFNMDFEKAFGENRSTVLALWCGMIAAMLTINPTAQARLELLVGLHGLFKDLPLPEAILPSLSDAYMYCSYALRRDKHAMKSTLHHMLARMLRMNGVQLPMEDEVEARLSMARAACAADPSYRPKMLVCVEWFTSLHAMYRCYAPIIRQLRKKFHLVGMCREMDIDDIGKAEFDEWYPISAENLVLDEVVRKVNEIEPVLIYNPSIGMALWWTTLASVRLAPIQFMTLGHPASSQSPHMDYVLCDEGAIGDPSLFTEKIVEYPHGSARFVMRHDAVFPQLPPPEPYASPVRVAVPAMLCKLNAPFMQTLAEIKARAKRDVEFHFFVNMVGLNLFETAAEIREIIPNAVIYERDHYVSYINNLSRCHLHCSTFPFGGTNSNIDSFKVGLPIVTLWGDQPHERYDGMMIKRAGLPSWLIANTREEYVRAALRLIDSDNERFALAKQLRATDIDGIFFGDPPEEHRDAIVKLVWNIFKEHGNGQQGS